jgi:hypothetical protein
MLKFPETATDFSNLRFSPSLELSNWLVGLKTAEPISMAPDDSDAVQFVEVGNGYSLDKGVTYARGTIFIRHFYARLLDAIWEHDRVALIGNPGIGKSCFQDYVLLRMAHGGSEHIQKFGYSRNCVIRQVGKEFFEVFLIEEGKAFTVKPYDSTFLNALDPSKCLYLYEPGNNKRTEPQIMNLKSLATVSPNHKRIKEYLKNSGTPMFMPTWTWDELKQVGSYLRRLHPHNTLYSEDSIMTRFEQFGGILRYVVPASEGFLVGVNRKQEAALTQVDFSVLLHENTAIDGDGTYNVSHFLLHYVVDQENFLYFRLAFHSNVYKKVVADVISKKQFPQLFQAAAECARGINSSSAWRTLEVIVPIMWERGVEWTIKKSPAHHPEITLPKKLSYNFLHEKLCPKSPGDMVEDKIYVPGNPSYPFVEMFFKHRGIVHGIQCKSGTTPQSPKVSATFLFREKIGLKDTDDLYVWYVTFQNIAEEWWKVLEKGLKPSAKEIGKLSAEKRLRLQNVCASTRFGLLAHDFDVTRVTYCQPGDGSHAAHAASSSRVCPPTW